MAAIDSYAPRLRVDVIRDGDSNIPKQKVENPETAAEIMRLHLGRVADEHMVVILLDTHNMLIGAITVAVGTVNSCPASTKNVIRPALHHNTVGLIVGHNHPSGKPDPSVEDVRFFKQLKGACELMDLRLLDCVIIGDGTTEIYSHRRSSFDL